MLVRLREAGGKRGLVALALWAACGCGGSVKPESVDLRATQTPADLRIILERIADRSDTEAAIARARIFDRLRRMGEPGEAADFLSRGDASDIALLSQSAPPAHKIESAERLAGHFLERAEAASLRRSSFAGPLGEPLLRFVLLSVAGRYAEYGSRSRYAEALGKLGGAAQDAANTGKLKPWAARWFEDRSKEFLSSEKQERAAEGRPPDPSPAVQKFCEHNLARHIDEAVRTADLGVGERAEQGDETRAMEWYVTSLVHFVTARECLSGASSAQENALATLEIVVRSLADRISAQ